MSYVDKHLLTGERVVYRSRQHWIVFTGPAVIFAAGVLMIAVGGTGTGPSAAATVLVLAALIWAIVKAVVRASAEFAVTNKRVLVKLGTIRRHSIETLLSKIEAIGVDQDIAGRLLNYGSIVVVGTGGSKEIFTLIADPLEFRRQVHEQIEAHTRA